MIKWSVAWRKWLTMPMANIKIWSMAEPTHHISSFYCQQQLSSKITFFDIIFFSSVYFILVNINPSSSAKKGYRTEQSKKPWEIHLLWVHLSAAIVWSRVTCWCAFVRKMQMIFLFLLFGKLLQEKMQWVEWMVVWASWHVLRFPRAHSLPTTMKHVPWTMMIDSIVIKQGFATVQLMLTIKIYLVKDLLLGACLYISTGVYLSVGCRAFINLSGGKIIYKKNTFCSWHDMVRLFGGKSTTNCNCSSSDAEDQIRAKNLKSCKSRRWRNSNDSTLEPIRHILRSVLYCIFIEKSEDWKISWGTIFTNVDVIWAKTTLFSFPCQS